LHLRNADLSHAKLTRMNATADMRDSVLIDANFPGARLSNADFTGANFRGVRGFESAFKAGAHSLP